MKIENQVTTLKQSGILDSLGIKMPQGQYYWVAFTTASGQEFVLCRPASHVEEHSKEWAWYMVGDNSEEIQAQLDEDTVNADGMIYNAFTVSELSSMIGKGTKAAELHWQWLIDCVNSGQSSTIAQNVVALAGFVITQLQNETLAVDEVNKRLIHQ